MVQIRQLKSETSSHAFSLTLSRTHTLSLSQTHSLQIPLVAGVSRRIQIWPSPSRYVANKASSNSVFSWNSLFLSSRSPGRGRSGRGGGVLLLTDHAKVDTLAPWYKSVNLRVRQLNRIRQLNRSPGRGWGACSRPWRWSSASLSGPLSRRGSDGRCGS